MKNKQYQQIISQLPALLESNNYEITILSNASALLNLYMTDINWVGFYLNLDNKLQLGPFQGKPACTTIPFTKGVCGCCASTQQTIVVENVHNFPGHIACDSASNSEICVPIFIDKKFYGLLDIDSPIFNRFDDVDKLHLETIVKVIENSLNNLKN